MGKVGKILLGATIGVAAVAAVPFTGGGSVLAAGTTLLSSLTTGTAITAATTGAVTGAVVDEINKKKTEKIVKTAKAESFKDGVKEGVVLTAQEIKNYADFYLATTALSYYIARCDGGISAEEQAEIDVDLDAIYKNTDISNSIKSELYNIAHNENIGFADVKKYLDKISVEELNNLNNDIDEIINASGGINDDEANAKWLFESYLKGRNK